MKPLILALAILLLSGCISNAKKAAFYDWAADRLDPASESHTF